MNPRFSQVTPVDQLTVKTVVKVCGDPAVFPVQPAFPGLPVLPVWTVTASRHSASCPWWRRRFLRRTPAWRAPMRCEGRKTERLEEKPAAEDLSIWVFCHLVCMFVFFFFFFLTLSFGKSNFVLLTPSWWFIKWHAGGHWTAHLTAWNSFTEKVSRYLSFAISVL